MEDDSTLYVADTGGNTIRKISSGMVTTLAGTGEFDYLDGPANISKFASPSGLAIDTSGNILIADRDNNMIRKITPSGTVNTLVGVDGLVGYSDGSLDDSDVEKPKCIAIYSNQVFFSDSFGIKTIDSSQNIVPLYSMSGINGMSIMTSGKIYASSVSLNGLYYSQLP